MKKTILISLAVHTLFICTLIFGFIKKGENIEYGTAINIEISEMALSENSSISKINDRKKFDKKIYINALEKIKSENTEEYKKNSEVYSITSEYSKAIINGKINGISLPLPIYPPLAKKRGITGTNKISITILPNGNIKNVEIIKSSGNRLLDKATIDIIEKRWKLPPPNIEIIVQKIFEFEIIN